MFDVIFRDVFSPSVVTYSMVLFVSRKKPVGGGGAATCERNEGTCEGSVGADVERCIELPARILSNFECKDANDSPCSFGVFLMSSVVVSRLSSLP